MAKQLNLIGSGQVIPTALHSEMERSYLEYAMSVIVGRALPDVRDGLKPVHRRILYAMHELGLTPDRPYRKCARVVGDVLGKYHPHGDQAVYDALVRMVQDFATRYPLLDGHGNFGSVDNDPAAAMRYTETRLAPIAHEALLGNIGEETVDFASNFDNSQQEPVVLPAQLPILLLNGCAGIAVGMATNVPPHNLGEVVDGLVALIDRPDLPDEKLWEIIPGPDFPTGGEIVDPEGIRDTYRTGRGTMRVRGIVSIEQLQHGRTRKRERTALVITELPYQVNKAGWIEKVAELVNAGRIEGIADLRDESDRNGMRVVVELKRDATPDGVLEQLYHQTALQSNFGAIFLALVDKKPCQLSLRELLQEFLKFREQTLTRQYTYTLDRARGRLHVVEGLTIALEQIDIVIEILRNAADGSSAKQELQVQLGIDDTQADSILAMPLRRLTGLERQKLQSEVEDLRGQIEQLETLLGDRGEFYKALKKELRALKRKFDNPRRTRIRPSAPKAAAPSSSGKSSSKSSAPANVPEQSDRVLEITYRGHVQWRSPAANNAKAPRATKRGEDLATIAYRFDPQHPPIAITGSGKAHLLNPEKIPSAGEKSKKMLLSALQGIASATGETIAGYVDGSNGDGDLLLLTREGRIKRLAASELGSIGVRGLSILKLKEDDRAIAVCTTKDGEEAIVATDGGRLLRIAVDEAQLPHLSRTAQGYMVSRLRQGEAIVGCLSLATRHHLAIVSTEGFAKRLPASAIPRVNRGERGTQAIQFSSPQDRLCGIAPAPKESAEIAILTSQDRILRLAASEIPIFGKDGIGDRLPKLRENERVLGLAPIR